MSRIAFVNGQYKNFNNSMVHIEDRGFQFGDGVYEVFAVINNSIVDYDGHINRLFLSLSKLNIKPPISKKSLLFHIINIKNENLIEDGLIYLQITRGVSSRDFKFPLSTKSSIVIIGKIISDNHYNSSFKKGIKVCTTKDLRWKRVDIKSLNLLPPVLAKQSAYERGCEESWLVDEDGFITEGCSSNAWILIKDTLITRPVSNSILNGITRSSLIKGLKKNDLKIKERKFNFKDIKNASEAYITSATQHVMPVIKIDNLEIGNGKPGEYASVFKDAYMESILLLKS